MKKYDTPLKRAGLAQEYLPPAKHHDSTDSTRRIGYEDALFDHASPLENTLEEVREELAKLKDPWISVKEKLPLVGMTVLVFCQPPSGTHYSVHTWTGNPVYTFITHWMPLPSPPTDNPNTPYNG